MIKPLRYKKELTVCYAFIEQTQIVTCVNLSKTNGYAFIKETKLHKIVFEV